MAFSFCFLSASKPCLSAFERQKLNLVQNPSCKRVRTCGFSLFLVLIIQEAGKNGVEKDARYQNIVSIPVPLSHCKEQIMAEKVYKNLPVNLIHCD